MNGILSQGCALPKRTPFGSSKVGLLGLCLILPMGCSNFRNSNSSKVNSESAIERSKTEIVIAYFGGFNSCGAPQNPTGLFALDRFLQLKNALTVSGLQVHTITSCYRGVDSNHIVWQSSLQPDFYSVAWDDPGAEGQLFDEVVLLTENFRRPLFVIGHSYGGWLSTNLAAHLTAKYGLDEASKVIEALITIDPISPYHCNQATYAGTVLQWASPGATLARVILGPGDCERAPIQITQADRRIYPKDIVNIIPGRVRNYVKNSTKRWLNFFQERDFLHSSAIASSDGIPENRLVSYTNVPMPGTNEAPHNAIHRDAEVWTGIHIKMREARNAGYR